MLQALELRPEDRVLELGTGSGYQTALLCEIAQSVISIERHAALAQLAQQHLTILGYANFQIVVGDGTLGYPPRAPYDAIIVSAAAPEIPPALIEQLAVGGRMVLPVGSRELQDLVLVRKTQDGIFRARLDGCAFVPLIGREGFRE
jgi:protein-L-isoaspartate(D-aspartate) O-methyltransferase